MANRKNSLKYNGSGYYDPTAYAVLNDMMKQPREVHRLISKMKDLAEANGYEVVGRIVLKDKKTGKVFK